MNDFSELESELKQLRPSPVTRDLINKIERDLAQASPATAAILPRHRFFQLNSLSLGLGLAAAAVFLFLARINVEQPGKSRTLAAITPAPSAAMPNSPDNFVPAGVTQVVYNTRDEGLHFASGGSEPMRRLRSRTRETMQWENPHTGASLRVSYPSEEVTLIPVPGQ